MFASKKQHKFTYIQHEFPSYLRHSLNKFESIEKYIKQNIFINVGNFRDAVLNGLNEIYLLQKSQIACLKNENFSIALN